MLELLVKKDAPCLLLVCYTWCCPVFLSPSILLKFKLFAGFHVRVLLLILEKTAQNLKAPKGRSTAAFGGLQTGFAAGQG